MVGMTYFVALPLLLTAALFLANPPSAQAPQQR
jgi:hypothetical protein